MLVRSALLLAFLTSSAQAAPFDDVKEYLSSCLRFELASPSVRSGMPAADKARFALTRCAVEFNRLERADGRRLRGDGGISPSTKAVLQNVFGRGGSGVANVRY